MYELSQEKSRSGLGEIYADAFLSHAAKSSGSGVSQQLEAARSTAMALFSKVKWSDLVHCQDLLDPDI